ncbi:MAG: excinuclease ABC subunit UvrC [Clostridiales Family XIII bacterium]|jgi:excinuclease ABC subunit C|nr:excinuclease ABC subunit UvrC [Clostridiales Family XIII bacterium]
MFNIEENLKQLPSSPGVYLHKDASGEIIYVGKASSLRNRVRQYFRPGGRDDKTTALASHIAEFEYIVTNTEAEALLLENTLIKRYRPRYNVMLRDDKTYPYIKITLGEEWPRLLKTRVLAADGSKYFGPYADVGAVNRIIALLNDVYRLKRCALRSFPKRHRPCLHGHIDRCRRVCLYTGGIGDAKEYEALHDEYMGDIERILRFLKGNGVEVERYITERMNEASGRMDYEEAARWRDYLSSAKAVTEKQRVELLSSGSMDVVLAAPGVSGDGASVVTVFFVRDGKLTGRERHLIDAGSEPQRDDAADTVAAFISQYYVNQSSPPREILTAKQIPDEQFIADALSESCGYRIKIHTPIRGAKKELLRLAQNDVNEAVRREEQRVKAEEKKRERLSAQFEEVFGGPLSRRRIEAYDISHTGGADSVGAMVVFEDGEPTRSGYRRFKIRGEAKGDDYAAMQEVLYRRLKRAIAKDKSFLPLPGLILIDGGKGHVTAVRRVLEALSVSAAAWPGGGKGAGHAARADDDKGSGNTARTIGDILVAGMVKDDKHRTRALIIPETGKVAGEDSDASDGEGEYAEVELKGKPELFHLIGRIQEEVHRFVIDYHHTRRTKGMTE